MKKTNTIMGRGFMEWICLAIAVMGIIVLINRPLTFSSLFLAFLIGNCFGIWVMGGFIIKYQRFCNIYSEMIHKMLKDIKDLVKLGGNKKNDKK